MGAVLAGALLAFYLWTKPPNDETVIRNFEGHRGAFEQLRDMLKADTQVVRVAEWGVETTNAPGTVKPPNGGLPVDRYDEYLLLLRNVGGKVAYRGRGEYPESVGIVVWASGFAADTRHIAVCWFEHPRLSGPSSVALGADGHSQTFKHIEGDWYLCKY